MKTLIFIVFTTGILLKGCSCTEENLEIEGKVLDEKTKVPIPHREIIVQALVKSDYKVIPVYHGRFSTDSSGFFKFPLSKVKNVYLYNFSIVGDSVYAYANIELGLTELKKYDKVLYLHLNRLTDLTIIIDMKSRSPFNEVLYVSWKSDGTDGKYLYPYTIKNYGLTTLNTGLKWVGEDIQSEIMTKVFADKETIVRWEIYSYAKRMEVTDTIFCIRDVANYVRFKY